MAKRQRPNIAPKSKAQDKISNQEEIIQKLKQEDVPKVKEKKKKIRFTMDLPVDLHQKIKSKATRQGQIMKGYFVALALRDLEND